MRTVFVLLIAGLLQPPGGQSQRTAALVVNAWSSTNGPYGAVWHLKIASNGSAHVTSGSDLGAKGEERRFTVAAAAQRVIVEAVEDARYFALPESLGPPLVFIHGPENCLEIRRGGRVRKIFLHDPESADGEQVRRFQRVWNAISSLSRINPPL